MTEAKPKPFHRRLYEGWLVIAGHFGEVQTSVILFFSFLYVLINLLVDLSYLLFDPRIRY